MYFGKYMIDPTQDIIYFTQHITDSGGQITDAPGRIGRAEKGRADLIFRGK
jgi:hypothetical protein